MKVSHMHLGFKNLEGAVCWMKDVLAKEPGYRNANMATFDFENTSLVFDQSDDDTVLTFGVKTLDCDRAFAEMQRRGAVALDEPTDQPWGVRAAYIQGPGGVTLEIEQTMRSSKEDRVIE